MLRREPYLRSENLLQYALDELARLKNTKTRTTDGKNLVIAPPGSSVPGGGTVPAPPEGAPHVLFGSKNTNSLHVTADAGLDVKYEGSQVWIGGVFYTIAAGTLTLDDDATNYVFVDSTGTVTSNTTGFPTESLPLAIVVTVGGAITSVTDQRAYLSDQGLTQAHTLFGTQHTESLRVTDGGTDTVPVAAYEAGQVWLGSTFYSIAAGSIDLTPDDTNYVFVRASDGTVDANTTGFPTDCVPMAVVTAVAENITAIDDRRSYLLQFGSAYSDEQAQDAVGLILANTDEITLSYDDGTPQITADINADSVVVGRIHFTDTALLLGRSTAAAGAGEEISIGDGLDLTAGVLSATGTGATPHDLLDADQDQDTVAHVVLEGDIIFGNAVPAWDALPIGDEGDVLTVASGLPAWAPAASGYTDEQAEDAVGGILLDTASINFTYDDTNIYAVVLAAGVDHGGLGGLADNDHPQYILSSIFTADGDIIYRDVDDVVKALPIGGANKVLTVTSGVPAWQDPTGGGGSPAIPVWHRNFMMMGA